MAPVQKSPPSSPTGPTADGVQALLQFFDRLATDPDALESFPVERFAPDSADGRLLQGVRDLVERVRRSEQHARAFADRYHLVIRGADDGLWDWDLLTNELYLSPRWKQILGYEDHEIANDVEEWRARIHPDDLPRAMAAVRDYLEGRTPVYELEHRLRHKDGTYRWISTRGAVLRDAGGKAYRFAGAHWDITERKRAEEQLREREQQYRSIFEATTDALLINDLETGVVVEANPAACRMYGYSCEELIGLHPAALIHPDQYRYFPDFLAAVRAGGELRRRAINVRKDGTPFHVEVRGSAFTFRGRPRMLGVLRDITDQVQARQVLEQHVEERTRELSTLLNVSKTLTSMLELRPLLGLILDQLQVIADYTACSVTIREGDEYVMREYRGPLPPEVVLGRRIQVDRDSAIAQVMGHGEAAIIADVWEDTPLARTYRTMVGEQWLRTTASYFRSWLGVPLMQKDEVIGVLALVHQVPNHYTPRHAALAMAIANQAAVAIENARLYERAQQVAVLEERQRLARELHDSVAQILFSIRLSASTARALLERDPTRVGQRVDQILSLAEMGTAEMRALLFELRPESLAMEGLVAALTKQAAALQARHGITVEATLCDEPDVPLETKEALYRIAQEALHNTVKHARAGRVELRLACDGTGIRLEVRDDGVGFDPSGSFPGHLGQRSMRERAGRLGGTFDLDTAPGGGTAIHVTIPPSRAT